MRWPEGPPHLALNPPYFFFVSFFVFFSFCFCFGGFKGQVRWPKGPPHLALNPPYLLFFCFFLVCCCSFLCFVIQKKPCFTPRKGRFLFIFECLPLVLLSFFGAPPFSISLSLSLASSCPFFLSFLSFFFAFFCFLVLSLSFLFFLLCFCFMKRTTSEYSITKFSFINIFPFLVSCLLFSLKSLFLIFVFC